MLKYMMEMREKEEMIQVSVSNIAVNRKSPDELFVIEFYLIFIAIVYCIDR